MQDSLNSSIGYFSDGLVRALVTFFVVPTVVAYLAFGVLGIVGAALAHWVCYRGALRIGLARLGSEEATTIPRPKHWLLGFGFAIVFQAGIVLFCFAYADQETISDRWNRILSPELARDRPSSGITELRDVRDAARADRLAGRYEEALEKYVWYHENELGYDPSQSSVRLTFVLYDWLLLADAYPPALEKLKEIRDTAREAVKSEGADIFRDFIVINEALEEEYRTVELFKWLDVNNPSVADSNYIGAEDALVAAREYALCGKYVGGIHTYFRKEKIHRFNLKYDSIGSEGLARTKMRFSHEIALLVALLVRNNRSEEASKIADRALRDWAGHVDEQQISQARSGVIPTKP